MGHWDLYVIFSYKALELTRHGGYHSYILPSSVKTEKYARDIRNHLVRETNIHALVDFGEYSVFKSVDRQCVIYVACKEPSTGTTEIVRYNQPVFNSEFNIDQEIFLTYNNTSFRLDISPEDMELKDKLDNISTSLGSICCVNPGIVAHSAADSELDFNKEDILSALLKSDLISRYHRFRRMKPRKSNLPWKLISSTSSSSVVT